MDGAERAERRGMDDQRRPSYIPLNYYARGRYDFKGGWGNKGTEILLPLSPHHLLYTRVGHRVARNAMLNRQSPNIFKDLSQSTLIGHCSR
jgi:hypothetical protein